MHRAKKAVSNPAPKNKDVLRRASALYVRHCRYPVVMSEARDFTTDAGLETEELDWLDDRIAEYQELLAYLRDH